MIRTVKFFLVGFIFSIKCFAQQPSKQYLINGIKSIAKVNFNENINKKTRSQIKLLSDQLVASFYEKNTDKLISLFSDGLKTKHLSQSADLINEIHPLIKTKKYALLDEYLANNSNIGQMASLFKSASQDNDYQINYKVYSRETYIALLICKNEVSDLLFTCIYGKYNGNWKLDVILIGKYKIRGKTAVDLYKQAKIEYTNNDLFDATKDIGLSEQIGTPAKDVFVYFKLPEMKNFAAKLEKDVKSKIIFPITITEIKTAPRIITVQPVEINEGVFPAVSYMSKISLKDTVALKAENEQIKKVIGSIFPGIDKNNKYVFFKAFNQMPDGKTPIEHYGFMLKNIKN